jgi:alpha-L-fucosidase 2
MKKLFIIFLLFFSITGYAQPGHKRDLQFDSLATSWDEGIPLGNGMLGALIWEKNGHLRYSLDRADLWDLRPMKGLNRPEFNYHWVYEHVINKNYKTVQQYFDNPYEQEPAPTKIPGAALEFDIKSWGPVQSVHLSIADALCEIKWQNGTVLKTFIHATQPMGWFRFENVKGNFSPELIPPAYQGKTGKKENSVTGDDLSGLGYEQGRIIRTGNHIIYKQNGWSGFKYEVSVSWKKVNPTTIEGVWSISSNHSTKNFDTAEIVVKKAMTASYQKYFLSHAGWWKNYWEQSAIHVPDSMIEKQWYLEQYKFGCVARRGAPVITLQAIWTADNGRLPPWKGDVHNDLNTELSYWPAYSGNHLKQALSYTDWLWKTKAENERYTRQYFGVKGLNVPGVQTLAGNPMGGWIQYACSPTIAAWLSQHFYWQWKYSMDSSFLRTRAYPWIKEVATYLENITVIDGEGYRKLPISSSPEINNNSINAWFFQNTNYDLALMKFAFGAAAELASSLHLKTEADHWKKILSQFRPFALSANDELMFAPTMPYNQSHRHLSHLMAIYPLGLIRWENGEKDRRIIQNSLHLVDSIGPAGWCGFTYSWMAALKARAKDGKGAAKALDIFAKAFCLKNSFHVNGDQTKSGYSGFTYRPFTLEGNFAFANGLQEMLLQSYVGFIEIFPAVPAQWKHIDFEKLRAEGAFLVSAEKTSGQVTKIKIISEKGGDTKLKLPFKIWHTAVKKNVEIKGTNNGFITLSFQPAGEIVLKNGSE